MKTLAAAILLATAVSFTGCAHHHKGDCGRKQASSCKENSCKEKRDCKDGSCKLKKGEKKKKGCCSKKSKKK